jgi:hypothetical protein
MADRPNFYVLLELDPSVDDWEAIRQRIVEQRGRWSQDLGMGLKARRRAESCLARLPEIETVLKDPEARRLEARGARRELDRARQERTRALDERIEVLRSGGGCEPQQLAKLVGEFASAFSAGEIEARIRAAGVPITSVSGPARRPRAATDPLDKAVAAGIRCNLDHLGLMSLYDLLDLGPKSSTKALCDRADAIYQENQSAGKTDADATARNELASAARALFRSESAKRGYDAHIAVEAMAGLKPHFELAGADGFLTRQEVDALVRQARLRGVAADDAQAYIEDYASRRKWKVQGDLDGLPSAALRQCGFCATLAAAGADRCTGCGEALEIACPRCGLKSPSEVVACPSCGCHIGDSPLVTGLLKEGERLALEGATTAALLCLDKALLYWPDWAPALEARRRIGQAIADRESELAALERLAREAKLSAARAGLERFERRYGGNGLAPLRQRIAAGLAKAEGLFAGAEQALRAGFLDDALAHGEEALSACVDFEPARRLLSANPPPPPGPLQVHPLGSGFHLSWQPAPSSRAYPYRVLRKGDGPPQSPMDGGVVGEGAALTLDDAEVPAGRPWYYAVFTVRGDLPSRVPAASGPHLRLTEVADLVAVAGSGEVTLCWSPPAGCLRVEVWRCLGAPPPQRGDGVELAGTRDGVRDSGLANGSRYGYRIHAVYPDPAQEGRELHGPGRAITATPLALPQAVMDLNARRSGRTVVLSWTPLAGAAVEIRQATGLPDCAPGSVLAASQTGRFGKLLPSASAGTSHTTLLRQGRYFFLPLSIAGGTAVVGRAAEVTSLDPVSALTARRAGAGIALTWQWPEGTDEVLVAYAHDRAPDSPLDGRCTKVRLTRREYDRSGCWQLPYAERRALHFSVFAKASGTELYSPGVETVESMGQEIAVSYRVVVKQRLLRRAADRAWIELRAAGAETSIPALLVVGKVHNVPLSPADGEVLAELPELLLESGRALLPIPARRPDAPTYVRLFFKDPTAARRIRLLPAARENLRFG